MQDLGHRSITKAAFLSLWQFGWAGESKMEFRTKLSNYAMRGQDQETRITDS